MRAARQGCRALQNVGTVRRAAQVCRPYGGQRSRPPPFFRRGRSQTGPREGQAPPLRRFACKWNGASGRPRPTGIRTHGRGNSLSPLSRCARQLPLIRGVVLPYGFQEALPGLGRGGPWASRRERTVPPKGTLIRPSVSTGAPSPFKGEGSTGAQCAPLRQEIDRYRWFGKSRRGCRTAPVSIFRKPGPSGPE